MDFSVRCLFDVLQQGAAGDLETLADDLLAAARACRPGMGTMWRCFSPGWIGPFARRAEAVPLPRPGSITGLIVAHGHSPRQRGIITVIPAAARRCPRDAKAPSPSGPAFSHAAEPSRRARIPTTSGIALPCALSVLSAARSALTRKRRTVTFLTGRVGSHPDAARWRLTGSAGQRRDGWPHAPAQAALRRR